jgi:hypothetical protein
MHTVVTSFSPAGFEQYGRTFLESFTERWPETVRCVVYYEAGQPPVQDYRCSGWPIAAVDGLVGFFDKLRFPIMCGQIGPNYNINYDARMARKTFIQCDAVKRYGGKVFWVDADVFTHSDVPETFPDDMLPDDKMCCYLGREGWYYTESGFIGFNADHPLTSGFMKAYRNVFLSGGFLALKGWHDCFAFDAIKDCMPKDQMVNLSKGLPDGTMHPFVNSALGAYMDHRKGKRKDDRSTQSDLVHERNEPYWQAAHA